MSAVLVLVVAAIGVGSWLRSPEQAAADAAPPPPSLITVAAEERVLAQPIVLRGRVLPGDSVKILPPAAAIGPDSVVTQVLVKKGKTVREGQVLVTRAGQPLFTLNLPFPLYRDLVGGMEGPDVTQVQKALIRLRYPIVVTGRYGWPTVRAVSRLYADRGFEAPPGSVTAEEGLSAARDRVRQAQTAYDSAVAMATGVAEAKAALDRARRDLATMELEASPGLPRSAVIRVSRAGGKVTAVRVQVGDILDTAETVLLELDGGAAYVAAAASRDQIGLITIGQSASVVDEATGREATAVVEEVGREPTNDPNTALSGFLVRLAFAGEPLTPINDRTVRIGLTVVSASTPVLAVPLTAIYSRADGSTFVTVLRRDNTTVDVIITAGRIAAGWVEVTALAGDALAAGDRVVVGHGGTT